VHGLFTDITASRPVEDLTVKQRFFGYTREDMDVILKPMAIQGKEPVGSMGNDAALAVLSERPQLLFQYFKQLFAQVTNPPIDPIREELVMSLMTYIGNKGNILDETPEHARLIKLRRPVLTDDELRQLQNFGVQGYHSHVLSCGFPVKGGEAALRDALKALAEEAVAAAKAGEHILILSDHDLPQGQAAIPSLLSCSAVNRALVDAGLRPETGLIVQSGEVREVMHFALLLGYGATAINPYLALATVSALANSGAINLDPVTAAGNYIQAVDKGQYEASRSLGLSGSQTMRKIILPQAIRICIPSVVNQCCITIKDTSIISVIGLAELTKMGQTIIARTYRSFEVWVIVGAMYFIVIYLIIILSMFLEKKVSLDD
jgi:glutamate synthase (NADPH/NADH) large chain